MEPLQGQAQESATPAPTPHPTTGQPTPSPHPDLSKPPASSGESRPAPIWVAPDEFAAIQAELRSHRDFRRQHDAELEAVENERLKEKAEKGQAVEAYKALTEKFEKKIRASEEQKQAIESKWLAEQVKAQIAAALTGKQFAGVNPAVTADMLRQLLEGEIEAALDAEGNPTVRDRKTRRPASEYLKDRIESPEFAVFFAATHRGGSGTDGTRPAAATPTQPDGSFEAYAESFKARQKSYQDTRYLRSQT